MTQFLLAGVYNEERLPRKAKGWRLKEATVTGRTVLFRAVDPGGQKPNQPR